MQIILNRQLHWFLIIMPSFQVMENNEYENLKKEIIRKVGNSYNLQKIKDCFSRIIDSRRALSMIQNLNDLFYLLEERDALDCNNVNALICVGNLLGREDIVNLVVGYKKLYMEHENCICTCGNDLSLEIPVVQMENSEDVNSLDTAIEIVAKNIGSKWRTLASELKIRECHIDEIREKYPKDMYKQALAALQIWKKYNKDEASVDLLKKGLEARLCKMKGIGVHMLTPLISVD